MNYYEVSFTITPDTEVNRDILSALLGEIGFESFTETEKGINAYINDQLYKKDVVDEILKDFPMDDVRFEYNETFVESKDWNEEWEKNFFQPIIINDQCVVHSSFHHDIPTLPYDIIIDPKMAFGTGHHETTSLMISYLLLKEVSGMSFLDMGCGTAVLAILAKMKGSGRTLAIDIDEWAYANSLENIKLNNTPDIEVLLGGAELLGKDTFDVIFANINRNILLEDIPAYVKCMHPGSELYMSGFYKEDIPAIQQACKKQGLQLTNHIEKNNWVAVRFLLP